MTLDIASSSGWMTQEANVAMCVPAMYAIVAGTIASVLLSLAIALNIFFIFMLQMNLSSRYEKVYLAFAGITAILSATIALVTDRIGFNYDTWECWFKGPASAPWDSFGSVWAFMYIWIALACLICTGCTITFRYVLYKNRKELDSLCLPVESQNWAGSLSPSKTEEKKRGMMNRAVNRISWYCVVPLISQFFNMAIDTFIFAGGDPSSVDYLVIYYIGGITGTLMASSYSFLVSLRISVDLRYT